jgi:hypothetical protein
MGMPDGIGNSLGERPALGRMWKLAPELGIPALAEERTVWT